MRPPLTAQTTYVRASGVTVCGSGRFKAVRRARPPLSLASTVSLPVARVVRERRRISTRSPPCAVARFAADADECEPENVAAADTSPRASAHMKARAFRVCLRFDMMGVNLSSGFSTCESGCEISTRVDKSKRFFAAVERTCARRVKASAFKFARRELEGRGFSRGVFNDDRRGRLLPEARAVF